MYYIVVFSIINDEFEKYDIAMQYYILFFFFLRLLF